MTPMRTSRYVARIARKCRMNRRKILTMGKRTYAMAVAINSKMTGSMIAPSPNKMIAPMIVQNRTVRAIRERLNQTEVEGESPGDVVDCSGMVFIPVPLSFLIDLAIGPPQGLLQSISFCLFHTSNQSLP